LVVVGGHELTDERTDGRIVINDLTVGFVLISSVMHVATP